MTLATPELKQTPLHEEHLALGARMVPFGGWEMPIQYEGILKEYEHTRKTVTLFDTSHMGEFVIKGDALLSGLEGIVTQPLVDMPEKSCCYGMMLNTKGGIIDDLIVFRLGKEEWLVVVNGATTEKDAKHFKQNLTRPSHFDDQSSFLGKLDLQGPLAREVLSKFVDGIQKLEYYTFDYFDLLNEKTLISRTGYTGELGYEIYFPWKRMKELWNLFLSDRRVKPAGLGARDILRLEMAYSLYGHELNEDITPQEAGLMKFVDLNKEFIGKEALVKQSKQNNYRKNVCFISENRRSPRAEQKIYSKNLEEIGVVTSGTFSPALQKGIGLGLIEQKFASVTENIFIGNEDNKITVQVTKRPFYKFGSLKN